MEKYKIFHYGHLVAKGLSKEEVVIYMKDVFKDEEDITNYVIELDTIILKLSDANINAIQRGLTVAMQTMDREGNHFDKMLADELEIVLNEIDSQVINQKKY